MSIPYEAIGRVDQKRRTRAALLQAARDLAAQGVTPTVEEAAAAAGVSRTTAYRYFASQRALLVAAFPEIEASSLLPAGNLDDPAARLEAVMEAFTRSVVKNEPQQRTTLRLSLEATPDERERLVLRQGRAIRWIDDALTPLRSQLPEGDLRRLVLAIRATAGIEALVWLKDVAGLSTEEAVDLMRWSARALLRATLAEHAERPDRRRTSRRQRGDGASAAPNLLAGDDVGASVFRGARHRQDRPAMPAVGTTESQAFDPAEATAKPT